MAGSWQVNEIANYPAAIMKPLTFAVSGNIYCFGGYNGSVYVLDAYVYSIADKTWDVLDNIPTCRAGTGMNLAISTGVYDHINNKIIFFRTETYTSIYTQLMTFEYNLSTQSFTTPMLLVGGTNNTYISHYAYYYNGYAYIFVTSNLAPFTRIYKYNCTDNVIDSLVWSQAAALPYFWGNSSAGTRSTFTGCMDKILVIPNNSSNYLKTFMFDITDGTYIDLGVDINYDTTSPFRSGATAFTIGSKAHLYGGCSNNTTGNGIGIFDFNTNTWSDGEPQTPSNISWSGVTVDKGSAYIFGGYVGSANATAITQISKYSYYLDTPTNLTVTYVNNHVKLDWSDNSDEEMEYVIERMGTDETTYTEIGTVPTHAGSAYTYTDESSTIASESYQYQIKARLTVL